MDNFLEVLKLWVRLRYPIYPYIFFSENTQRLFQKTFGSMLKVAWIMSLLHCVPTGSLFTRRRNRRITTEKTCYVGSNTHLCLEFYVNIVKIYSGNILWPSANCRFDLCDETYNKTDFLCTKYVSTTNFSTILRSVSFEITPTYTS